MTGLLRKITFRLWYFIHPPWDSGISPPELLDFIQTQQPGKALDLGCGTGTNVITLARSGWLVTGVDFVPRAIAIAKEKIRKAQITAEVMVDDVTQLKTIDDQFDFILDLGCFHGLSEEDKKKYLDQMDRVCKPSGVWLLYGFLQSSDNSYGMGLSANDIEQIQTHFDVISRNDGWERQTRPSAYFLLRKKPTAD